MTDPRIGVVLDALARQVEAARALAEGLPEAEAAGAWAIAGAVERAYQAAQRAADAPASVDEMPSGVVVYRTADRVVVSVPVAARPPREPLPIDPAPRAAHDAGYRRGYGNGIVDSGTPREECVEGDDDPGEAFAAYLEDLAEVSPPWAADPDAARRLLADARVEVTGGWGDPVRASASSAGITVTVAADDVGVGLAGVWGGACAADAVLCALAAALRAPPGLAEALAPTGDDGAQAAAQPAEMTPEDVRRLMARGKSVVDAVRRAAGPLSKAELARAAGVSAPTVADWLRHGAEEVDAGRPMSEARREMGRTFAGLFPATVEGIFQAAKETL